MTDVEEPAWPELPETLDVGPVSVEVLAPGSEAGKAPAGGEVHRGERAVVDAQGDLVVVNDVEHVEDVPGAAYEAEHSEMCTTSPGRA
ncbi:hypothetical protein [Streptomyces sp. NPDC046862]|uniref:hypothetical protein n=1 Tax=Streptomyces sp. NPDC046862 TaxID=3154603 RepID=UPI0034546081